MWREAARYEPRMGEDERDDAARALGRGGRARRAAGPASEAPDRVTRRRRTGRSYVGAGTAGPVAMADIKPQVYKDPRPAEYFTRFHEHVRAHPPGWVYELVRLITTWIAMLLYRERRDRHRERARRRPRDPRAEPLLQHGPLLRRRLPAPEDPVHGEVAALRQPDPQLHLPHGGVFPIRRGHRDEEAFKTAHAILARGSCVLMYAEGGRSRTGDLGEAKPGVGRLALESGVPVVPVAIHGSLGVRKWRKLRFPKVTVQFGEPITFPAVADADAGAAARGSREVFEPGAGDVHRARGAGPQRRAQVAQGVPDPRPGLERGRLATRPGRKGG